jgi:hypothetical protein
MAENKKEFSAIDAEPCVLYALTSSSSTIAIPVICNTDGTITVTVV